MAQFFFFFNQVTTKLCLREAFKIHTYAFHLSILQSTVALNRLLLAQLSHSGSFQTTVTTTLDFEIKFFSILQMKS